MGNFLYDKVHGRYEELGTVAPTKSSVYGEEYVEFLGYTNRKTKAKTIKGQIYYSLVQYISNKSNSKIKDKAKSVLARNTLYPNLKDKIVELNLKMVGWRIYYNRTLYNRLIQEKYIIFRLVTWDNNKQKHRKRYNYRQLVSEVITVMCSKNSVSLVKY
jgi:hypothetical protein